MKPELAALPLEVWADVFLSPYQWINRQELAQFYNNIKNHGFANKLEKLLHDCGKPTLRYLDIFSNQPDKTTQKTTINLKCRALLAVASSNKGWLWVFKQYRMFDSKECEFPETEMPENIRTFKRLSIRHFDDEILAFLNKIKPLFINVFLNIRSMDSTSNMHILFIHLLPMLSSIRAIRCTNECVEFLERHFPGTLALVKEWGLYDLEPASIPACLNWLSAPQDIGVDRPRFLKVSAQLETIFTFVDAVKKQFLTATTPSAFVIYLEFSWFEEHFRADEFTIENAATKEQLTVRNASFKQSRGDIVHYVEIVRCPADGEAKMREWIEKRAYYENKYNNENNNEANRVILIWNPTVGRISKKAEDKLTDIDEDDGVGPSTLAMEIKK